MIDPPWDPKNQGSTGGTESTGDSDPTGGSEIERDWERWNPGVELRVLHTDYASIVRPILQLVDELRAESGRQLVVLIPVLIPERVRYRLLHNQVDLVLANELHHRPDVVVARVPMSITPARSSRPSG